MIGKKVKNPSKGSSKAARTGGLADYIRAPELTNELEKCTYSNGRSFLTDSHQGQRAEMIALAQEAVRSKDPINHYVLSWREGEQPTPAQVEQAVDVLLDQMNLQGHQVIYGLHADTDNYHLHVAINRVHPDTLKPVEINNGFDIEALHQAVARIEQAQGWQREKNARYHIQDSGELKRTDVGSTVKKLDRRTVDMEVRTGEKSAKRIGIEEAGPIIKNAKSWQELHAGLAALGMRYEREGSGAKVFIGEVGIKASDVDRAASIAKLEKRLGLYQSAGQEKPHDYHHHTPQPYPNQARTLAGNGMRRLSQCRMASIGGNEKAPRVLHVDARPGRQQVERVRRATGRSEPLKQNQPGWKEYTTGRQADKVARMQRNADLKARHDAERKALAFRQKAERAGTLGGDWKGKGDLLNAMRSVLAAQQAAAKLDLREQHKAERQAVQQQHRPYPTYEQFLRERGGQELAERWRYKDSPEKQPCQIHGKAAQPIEHRDIRDFEHRIIGRDVAYRVRGAGGFGTEAFVDRGKKIDVLDYKSPAAVTAALQLGAQKFGGKITVTGNDEYKRLCVQLAVKNGIQLVNPELQPLIAAEKQRIEQQRTAEREAAAEQKRVKAQMFQSTPGKTERNDTGHATPNRTPLSPSEPLSPAKPEQRRSINSDLTQPEAPDLGRIFNTYLTPAKNENAQFAADLTTRANAKEAEQQPSHVTPEMLTGQPLSIDQMKALDKELDRLQAIAKGAALELKTNQPRPPEEVSMSQIDAQGIQLAKLAINEEAKQKWPTVSAKAFPEDQYQGDHWQHAATISEQQLADHLKTDRPLFKNKEWDATKARLETEASNWKGGIEWREKRLADLKPAKVAEALKAHAKAQQEAAAKRAAAFKQAAKKLHQVEQQMEATGTALFSQPEPLQREYKQVRELEHKQELEKAQELGLQRGGMSR